MHTFPWPASWNKSLFFLSLGFTLILSAFIRFVWLDFSPALLTQDEASIAFNARSIVETGQDEWGKPWPLVFSAFGDAKQPGMVYTTAAWIAATGWRITSVREVSALAGLGIVLAMSYWIWLQTRKPQLVLLTAAVVGLSPWPVLLSRLGLESNLALLTAVLGLVCWTKVWQQAKRSWVWGGAGAILLAFSTYTYIAYRLSLPLLLVSVALWLGWQIWQDKKLAQQARVVLGSILMTLILIAPGFLLGSTTRLNQVGLLRAESIAAPLTDLRNGCHIWSYGQGVPALRYGCVLLWNRFTLPVLLLSRSAMQHWSPDFWFVNGDDLIYRNPTQTGAFFFILIIPTLFGLLAAWRGWRLAWLAGLIVLIGSIPSIMTDTPQAIRLTPALIGMVTLIILGTQLLSDSLQAKWGKHLPIFTWAAVVVMCLITIPHFLTRTTMNSIAWLGHGEILAQATATALQSGHTVYIDPLVLPEPHIFLAVWNNIAPAEYQALEKAPSVDGLGFQRPTQLGSNMLFYTLQASDICALPPAERSLITIITPAQEALRLTSTRLLKESSNVHNMMAVTTFPLDEKSLQEQALFCAAYQGNVAQE